MWDWYHGCKSGIITTMNTTIKIHIDTRKKLKLLAALLDKSMMDVLDELVTEALKRVQTGAGQEDAK